MTPRYQCPRGHIGRFLEIRPLYRYEPRQFLWLAWIAHIVDGYLGRCTHHGCGRVWEISLAGVHEPASLAPQPPEADAERTAERNGDERVARDPPPELAGAVRRRAV